MPNNFIRLHLTMTIMKPIVSRITIYPIKSFDGLNLQKARIAEGGCLLHDREYAITDQHGKFINGKSNPLVHTLRTTFDLDQETVHFRQQEATTWTTFHLQKEKTGIESFLSQYFGQPIQFLQNSTGRFLDIPDISGATILSTSSLESVTQWYDGIDIHEARKRFRATIEIEGVPAFWEDQLCTSPGKKIEFKIGDVTLIGMAPRERCIVPTRNPETGASTFAFAKTFAKQRAATLPSWSSLREYDHYYYLSVDCHLPNSEIGKYLEVGSEVVVTATTIT